MRVVFQLTHPEFSPRQIFEMIKKEFEAAKNLDDMNLARLIVQEDYAEYITCCKNTWIVQVDEFSGCLFEYRGTRAGLLRLQPFPNLRWEGGSLMLVKEWDDVWEAGGRKWAERFPRQFYLFNVSVKDYQMSTPPEWQVGPFDLVERIPGTDKAVILKDFGKYPAKIVPYKNVYPREEVEVVE